MSTASQRLFKASAATLSAAMLLSVAPAMATATPSRPWMNTALTAQQRADKLLAAMSLSQKIHMLHGSLTPLPHTPAIGYIPPIPELGIPEFVHSDGPAGLRNGKDPATKFPAPISYAASWDTAIAQLQGRISGEEAKARGTDLLYGPGFNIARNPLGGRTFEYYGEDPFLSGTLAAANVRGIQSAGVMATLKHFAANNQETLRNIGNSVVPTRALHEIYFKPFEIAVRTSEPAAVMCSYNAVNNTHGCSSYYNLVETLRKRWGFNGFVVTDYPASWSPTDIKNGLNIEMPGTLMTSEPVLKMALQQGRITEADIDIRVRETLTQMFRFGLLDSSKKPLDLHDSLHWSNFVHSVNAKRGDRAAQHIAESGAVLLKNNNNILPLSTKKHRTIAISGDAAQGSQAGWGSSNVSALRSDNPLQEITRRSKGAKVTYASTKNVLLAAQQAKEADVALVYVNGHSAEGFDRRSINLSASDNALVNAVSAANKNTVVIVHTGAPVAMPWLSKVSAVLNMWEPGQAGGKATARLLYGDVNPSGHLPQTFPMSDGQWPAHTLDQFPGRYLGMEPHYTEGIFVGYRWYQQTNTTPLFPFGYGLSYTTFRYGSPQILTNSGNGTAPVKVRVTVTNTGKRDGATVAQVYVGKPTAGLEVPKKELAAYKKIFLKAGETRTVELTILPDQLSVFDVKGNRFMVKKGLYNLYIGSNANNTPMTLTYRVV